MKNIIKSLLIIVAVAAVAGGATWSYFSSQANVDDNTFATGTLEVRVNGQTTTTGLITMNNAAPGDCVSGTFTVSNYGAPWFAGPSTLDADELVISTSSVSGDTDLCNALDLYVGADRGWGSWMDVYNSDLPSMNEADLLGSRWTNLAAGNSETVYYNICLPDDGTDQSALQGDTCTFNFAVNGYTPHRSTPAP